MIFRGIVVVFAVAEVIKYVKKCKEMRVFSIEICIFAAHSF